MFWPSFLVASYLLSTSCGGQVEENRADGLDAATDIAIQDSAPCGAGRTGIPWRCIDASHVQLFEVVDCHKVCGETPCEGSATILGSIDTCGPAERCVEPDIGGVWYPCRAYKDAAAGDE